ncbi:hypothetical protein YPPY54_3334, partial [Yersinia pestis PY-54]
MITWVTASHEEFI